MNKLALIIEDSDTQASHFRSLLEEFCMEIIIAGDGRTGLNLAKDHQPGVIILDIQLPDMNGFQICQNLKFSQETAHIPIIMLTSQETHEAVVAGLRAGAIEFIPKDVFADAVLIETLRQMGFLEE